MRLNHIGQQYAGSGNYVVAMKAWLRAAELGDRTTVSPNTIISNHIEQYACHYHGGRE